MSHAILAIFGYLEKLRIGEFDRVLLSEDCCTGLCNRYVTQITCCREPQHSIVISIIPPLGVDEALNTRLLLLRRYVKEIDNDILAKSFKEVCSFFRFCIFQSNPTCEANFAMGIQTNVTKEGDDSVAFSENILKIEINGPDVSSCLPCLFKPWLTVSKTKIN